MQCPNCGMDNTKSARFCRNCRYAFQKSSDMQLQTFVKQHRGWEKGGILRAVTLFVRSPSKTATLFEDPRAPKGYILFVIGMFTAALAVTLMNSKTIIINSFDGSVKRQSNVVFDFAGEIVKWLFGSVIIATIISKNLPQDSALRNRNPIILAISVNGFRCVIDLIYYFIVLIWLPFEADTIVEVKEESGADIFSLAQPQFTILQAPSIIYQAVTQAVLIMTFVYSYYLLYQVLSKAMRLEGITYKLLIFIYVVPNVISKIILFVNLF